MFTWSAYDATNATTTTLSTDSYYTVIEYYTATNYVGPQVELDPLTEIRQQLLLQKSLEQIKLMAREVVRFSQAICSKYGFRLPRSTPPPKYAFYQGAF